MHGQDTLNQLRPITGSAPYNIAAPCRVALQASDFTVSSALRKVSIPHSPIPVGAAYQLHVVEQALTRAHLACLARPSSSVIYLSPLLLAGGAVLSKTHTSLVFSQATRRAVAAHN